MSLKLIGEVGLDGSGFTSGLNKLKAGALSFKGAVVSAFGAIGVGQLVKGTIEWAGKLNDAADNQRVNVEWFQKMVNGADLFGGSLEDVEKLLDNINRNRAAAVSEPGGKASQSFARLGMTAGDISGLSGQAFVQKLIDGFENSPESAAALEAVGGKAAAKLLSAFSARFESGTPIVSAEDLEQLDALGDRLTQLSTVIKTLLGPALITLLEMVENIVDSVRVAQSFGGGLVGSAVGTATNVYENVRQGRGFNVTKDRFFDDLFDMLPSSITGAQDKMDEIMQDRLKRWEALDALKAARAARNQAAPDFEGKLGKAAAITKGKSPATDALLQVGNFLGGNSGLINSIAEQQLQVARQSAGTLTNIDEKLGRLVSRPSASSLDDFDVP